MTSSSQEPHLQAPRQACPDCRGAGRHGTRHRQRKPEGGLNGRPDWAHATDSTHPQIIHTLLPRWVPSPGLRQRGHAAQQHKLELAPAHEAVRSGNPFELKLAAMQACQPQALVASPPHCHNNSSSHSSHNGNNGSPLATHRRSQRPRQTAPLACCPSPSSPSPLLQWSSSGAKAQRSMRASAPAQRARAEEGRLRGQHELPPLTGAGSSAEARPSSGMDVPCSGLGPVGRALPAFAAKGWDLLAPVAPASPAPCAPVAAFTCCRLLLDDDDRLGALWSRHGWRGHEHGPTLLHRVPCMRQRSGHSGRERQAQWREGESEPGGQQSSRAGLLPPLPSPRTSQPHAAAQGGHRRPPMHRRAGS